MIAKSWGAVLLLFVGVSPLGAQPVSIEFEPKVGVIGTKVTLLTHVPPGARARLGGRALTLSEDGGASSFIVPAQAATGFVEYVREDRTVGRSAVPFVVAGRSLVVPRLTGLRDIMDVFSYVDPKPSGSELPEPAGRAILSLDDENVFTIGELPPELLSPAVELHDAASAAMRPMSGTLFLVTARIPTKKLRIRIPPPVPTATATPD